MSRYFIGICLECMSPVAAITGKEKPCSPCHDCGASSTNTVWGEASKVDHDRFTSRLMSENDAMPEGSSSHVREPDLFDKLTRVWPEKAKAESEALPKLSQEESDKMRAEMGPCQSGSDGECNWKDCPQEKIYRVICPLYRDYEDD